MMERESRSGFRDDLAMVLLSSTNSWGYKLGVGEPVVVIFCGFVEPAAYLFGLGKVIVLLALSPSPSEEPGGTSRILRLDATDTLVGVNGLVYQGISSSPISFSSGYPPLTLLRCLRLHLSVLYDWVFDLPFVRKTLFHHSFV